MKSLKKEYKFDEKMGFLSEKGCKLPREKRSIICLGFICTRFLGELTEETSELVINNIEQMKNYIWDLAEKIKKYRKQRKMLY